MNPDTPAPTLPTVCIAERNPRIRAFLLKEFREAGYGVVAASNGPELAAAAAADPRPDVFVVDPGIPQLDRVLSGRAAALVRPMVAYALMPDCEGHPLLAAAAAVVEKGEDPRELRAVVEQVLRRGAARAAAAGERA